MKIKIYQRVIKLNSEKEARDLAEQLWGYPFVPNTLADYLENRWSWEE